MGRTVGARDGRSWWHDEARQMKRDGASLKEIAAKFERNINTVNTATRNVSAKHGSRRNRGSVGGFEMGSKLRVAVSFSGDQVQSINALALSEGVSFSLAVAKLVEAALHFQAAEGRAA